MLQGGKNCCGSNKDIAAGRRKDLSLFVQSCCLGALIRGLQNLDALLKKILIVAVRSCHCGELNRGLLNLETSCERNVFRTFRVYEKYQKYTRGLRTSGLRGRFKALPEVSLQKFPAASAETGFACKTPAKRL